MSQYKVVNPDNLPLVDYRELEPFQGELKDLSEQNYNKLLKSIEKHGFFVPIFIWKHDGLNYIMDAHQRHRVLQKANIEFENTGYKVPYVEIEAANYKDAKAKLLIITSQYGKITQEGLDAYIAEAALPEAETYEAINFDALSFPADDEDDETEEDEAPEVDEQNPPVSKLGEIYQLGNHRIICGSAIDENDTNALLGEQKVDLYLTDPPYNVDYTGKTKDALKIENDKKDDGDFLTFLTDSDLRADEHMKSGAAFYIFHADSEGYNFRSAVKASGWMLKQCLIWVKQSMVMGRQDYQWKHEPILYGWKAGASHSWYTDRKQTTVLNFDRPSRNAEHPTMKPINILAYLIKNSTKAGDLVFDNFLGSGSTMIACEQTDRICYGIELDPKYVDVIRKRYWKFTHDNNETGWEEGTGVINKGETNGKEQEV